MNKHEFDDYINKYIEKLNNINDVHKVKFFIKYLKAYMGEENLEIPVTFSILDKDFLLGSIEAYICENFPTPSKQATRDYRRVILDVCQTVCEDYEIKNDFMESAPEQADFYEISKEWIDQLQEPKSRECMSFDDYKTLDETITKFINTDNLEEYINKSIENTKFKPNYYGGLVSAIALKLIQKYGLDNKTIANLKITDLNIESRLIEVNGFRLSINDELISILKMYLKSRSFVIKNNEETDILFIKRTGTPYLNKYNYADNGQLFILMESALKRKDTTSLQYKTIIELVSKGANINLLSQLTLVDKSKIVEICLDDKVSLENIFRDINNSLPKEKERKKYIKGLIQCPYCGDYKDASSENWILIQVDGDSKKHIACRECKGLDGKYRY